MITCCHNIALVATEGGIGDPVAMVTVVECPVAIVIVVECPVAMVVAMECPV